jgi:hypothetical protein
MTNKPSHTKPIAFIAILTALAALALVAASASAAVGPQWRLDSLADTSVAPGEDLTFYLQATNVGDTAMDGTDVAVKATLPAGMTAKEAVLQPNAFDEPFNKVVCFAGDGVSPVAGATSVKCTSSFALPISPNNANYFEMMTLKVHLDPAAQGTPTVRFGIEGGGALTVEKADPTLVTDQPPAFDIDAFDGRLGDGSGAVLTQAGAHPSEATVFMDLTSHTDPRPLHGDASPVEPLKDVVVDLPPGLVGNPTVADTCTSVELAFGEITPLPKCPVTSQVGVVSLGMNNRPSSRVSFGEVSVYNLVPPPGAPARFGFNVGGTVTVLDAGVRSDGDYGLSVSVKNASEGLGVVGSEFTFWGVPSDPAHDLERSCPGEFQLYGGGPSCPSPAPQTAFMRNTTACTPAGVGLHSSVRVDSWFDPGDFKQASFTSHEDPGFPALPSEWGAPVGPSGCEEEPFSPSLDAQPGANRTDSPSGFAFDLQMPQEGFEDPEAVSESDLRKAVVTLPAGVRLNPSSADGLGACSPAQVAMSTAVGDPNAHFKTEQTACPESAKLGSLSIKTPLLGHEVPGAVYLAEPLQNPFGSLIALYLVADDPATGVRIVLAGKVDLDPQSGQITTSFDQNPQLPFETLHLSLDTGPRAALALPNACGTYTTHSAFLGWSGAQATSESSFTIKEGCDAGGFDPRNFQPLQPAPHPRGRGPGTGRPAHHPAPGPDRRPQGHPLLPRVGPRLLPGRDHPRRRRRRDRRPQVPGCLSARHRDRGSRRRPHPLLHRRRQGLPSRPLQRRPAIAGGPRPRARRSLRPRHCPGQKRPAGGPRVHPGHRGKRSTALDPARHPARPARRPGQPQPAELHAEPDLLRTAEDRLADHLDPGRRGQSFSSLPGRGLRSPRLQAEAEPEAQGRGQAL